MQPGRLSDSVRRSGRAAATNWDAKHAAVSCSRHTRMGVVISNVASVKHFRLGPPRQCRPCFKPRFKCVTAINTRSHNTVLCTLHNLFETHIGHCVSSHRLSHTAQTKHFLMRAARQPSSASHQLGASAGVLPSMTQAGTTAMTPCHITPIISTLHGRPCLQPTSD